MPRSNKRRFPKKSPPRDPTLSPECSFSPGDKSSNAVSMLLRPDQDLMIQRAVRSAQKHGICVSPGRRNVGRGDCAFESSIFNVNDRSCFKDKFLQSPTYYRQIWVTDMMNRTLHDETWRIGSENDWKAGWDELLKSGVYERGLFGDLMLLGIACGLRKFILIFNTSLDSPHDPIYVCDPRKFDVLPDTEVPVVLCYNQSHYESLHPTEESDIVKTVNLVQQYLTGQYSFCKSDLKFLLESSSDNSDVSSAQEERGSYLNKLDGCLPENLKGRRPSQMSKDEKREYRNIMKKMKFESGFDIKIQIFDENQDQYEIIVDQFEAPRKMKKLKDMNAKERKDYNRRIRQRYLKKETPTKKRERNERNAKATALKRSKETMTQKKKKNEKKSKAMADKRANTVPKEQFAARNAQKVFAGKQIVPDLDQTDDRIGVMNDSNHKCKFCCALKWKNESPTVCCNKGKIDIPLFPDPPTLIQDLLTRDTEIGKLFRKNTRTLNNALALSSIQVKLRNFPGGFVPCIVFEGKVCQRIGPLFPDEGDEPKFAQLYVHDPSTENTKRIQNMNLPASMGKKETKMMEDLLIKLQEMLKEVNPFVKDLLHVCEIPEEDLADGKLIISCKERPAGAHERRYNIQQSLSEVSVLTNCMPGDMVIRRRGGGLQQIFDIHPSAQPLHFVLLFPFGSKGYHADLKQTNMSKRISPREFFAYHINMRCLDSDYLFRFGRLFQEYLCLAYTTIESQRLKYQRDNQKSLRADSYKNVKDIISQRAPLTDKITADDHNLKIGRRIVLSSSFPGSPRWYNAKFQDGMAICRKYRKPDFFITFTCNPHWEEIVRELREHETVKDRPDLVSRVFKLKKDQLMKDIRTGRILGKVSAFLWVIEFQKRGLPHAHILVILSDDDRPTDNDEVDNIISAQLPPDPDQFPPNSVERAQAVRLNEIVLKNMVHGPCGEFNQNSPCMQEGKCTKGYPKPFNEKTVIKSGSTYPEYQRLDPAHGGRSVVLNLHSKEFVIDNSWIVPYSPYISLRFNCHANIELCFSPTASKYLFKYITKGEDRAMVHAEVPSEETVKDEIKEYIDLRSVGSSEASWHIFNFNISQNKPAVTTLRVHLKDEQQIVFDMGTEEEILEKQRSTELTAFFDYNYNNPNTNVTYVEFPEHFIYDTKDKIWRQRKNISDTIGRVHSVHPLAGDVYYLRMLLHHDHCKGKKSFDDLMSIEGNKQASYQEVARMLGLLQDDQEWDETLTEGSLTKMSSALRELFTTIVIFCHPANPKELFEKHHSEWADDFVREASKNNIHLSESQIKTLVLLDLQQRLQSWDKDVTILGIPTPTKDELRDVQFISTSRFPVLIREELDFSVDNLKEIVEEQKARFTDSQRIVYETVIEAIVNGNQLSVFIDARGGTGKTYVLNAILAAVRILNGGSVALAVGATGIAANLLKLGRTFHSRFKVPLNITRESICCINSQSTLADLIRMSKIIVWDEAPMAHRFQMEALDRTLRDITGCEKPFGGKVIILSGDFRQCLPVIPHASRAEVVNAALNRSPLWKSFTIYQLTENMRVQMSNDPDSQWFDQFTLSLGDGSKDTVPNTDMVELPKEMCIKVGSNTAGDQEAEKNSMKNLIAFAYPNLSNNYNKYGWMKGRAILAPTNKQVDQINNLIADSFPGKPIVLTSSDQVINPEDFQRFNHEYLNSLAPTGLPVHRLFIKQGMPLMLMRNLNPKQGLCNGTRLIFQRLHKNHLLECRIAGGEYGNRAVLIPRVTLQPKEKEFPFEWCRRQFPVRVAFAMTINKSQGQTLQNVGVWLKEPCFAHGQLYVAMSRVGSSKNIKFAIKQRDGFNENFTSNVVYKEALM